MNERDVQATAVKLVEESAVMMLGTLRELGEPHIKAVQLADFEGLNILWISTNTTSEHVTQLERDPCACLYFVHHDMIPWRGLALGGRVEIHRDAEARERFVGRRMRALLPLGCHGSGLHSPSLRFRMGEVLAIRYQASIRYLSSCFGQRRQP